MSGWHGRGTRTISAHHIHERGRRDCLSTGYEDLIAFLSLPDPDDHVLAAAIRAGAGIIVTYNLAHCPAETLAHFDRGVQHPDDFLVGLLDLAPGVVCAAVKRQR